MKNKQKIGSIVVLGLIVFYLMGIAVAASNSEVIIEDAEKTDMRRVKISWLDKKLEGDISSWNDLEEVYDTLYRHWGDDDSDVKPLKESEYKDNDYCDILEIGIEDLDEDNATFYVQVKGDIEAAERAWYLYIWSNCTDDDHEEFMIGAFFIPGGLGGDDILFYSCMTEELNVTGEVEFGDSGSSIEMSIPSDIWEDSEHCGIKAVLLTHDEEALGGSTYFYADIAPDKEDNLWDDFWFWFWLILIILLLIAALITIYYILKRRKQKKVNSSKPRFKGGK